MKKLKIKNSTSIKTFLPGQVERAVVDEIKDFLHYEAMLLDDYHLLWDWFQLLTDDFLYQIPVRVSRERHSGQSLYPEGSFHQNDNKFFILKRLERLETEKAWAEESPSRVRRVISGVMVMPGEDENHYHVRSSFVLYRGRDRIEGDVLFGQRHDLLRRDTDGLKLAHRVVYLDHTTLPTRNLSFFF
ncbi:aromatic-ring-hydroxylating dioxygenase subunit beta [Bacillus sp. B15-48]|uniref:aromatic-ring-hydroxylating dioxygenase subunit beta n=1 Tax=Bacillus sp. B15-48 TaxID=1548601 RepID=UPI00193ED29F|nr:aromatic-ring-hydroxylating dioxygenase subunit beta [Bacillus sp. B15-48]MBM4764993.1 3-phenylpropionate/cinnamic acid dioxygenase subunit beta [Bacillus sp. B15-48]